MLSRSIIFCFSFLGIFALLFVSIPGAFFAHQASWTPTYFRTDEQVVSFFNAHNITVYNSQASGNLTYPDEVVVQAGLPAGQQLNVWWGPTVSHWAIDGYTGIAYDVETLGISYETQHWLFGIFEYWTYERLHYTNDVGVNRGNYIIKDELVDDFDTTLNGTFYDARCDSGIQVTIIYTPNSSSSIGQSWDDGYLNFQMSYELNASISATNMWSLLAQILTFQAPNLGISGFFGDLLNAIIAIPITALILFIIYKLITGIAPWFSGGSGD